MKRQWRKGRIFSALLLLAVAWFIDAYWPAQPCWSMPTEQVLGIDSKRNLLRTIKLNDPVRDALVFFLGPVETYNLQSYDLSTGRLQQSTLLTPVMKELVDAYSLDPIERFPRYRSSVEDIIGWQWEHPANSPYFFAFHTNQNHFLVFDLESGRQLKSIPLPTSFRLGGYLQLSISADNQLLVLQGANQQIIVIDLSKSKVIDSHRHQAAYPLRGSKRLILPDIHINAKHGLLAYADYNRTILRDFRNRKNLIEYPKPRIPRLLNDGNVLILTPLRSDKDNEPVWFRRQPDGSWKQLDIRLANEFRLCDFVSYVDDYLVTESPERLWQEQPSWMPKSLWDILLQYYPLRGVRHRVQFWNLQTGQLVREFTLFEKARSITTTVMSDRDDFQDRVTVSSDANWLTQQLDGQLYVWDLTGRRTLWRWSVLFGIVACSVWLAWPRPFAKPIPPRASPHTP